jgi:hypothetical protein
MTNDTINKECRQCYWWQNCIRTRTEEDTVIFKDGCFLMNRANHDCKYLLDTVGIDMYGFNNDNESLIRKAGLWSQW